MDFLILLNVFLFAAYITSAEEIDSKELRCLVCRKTVDILQDKLAEINPTRVLEIGDYRLDADGNSKRKKIPLAKSESHISETLDEICDKFDDYARAKYKKSRKLVLVDLQNTFNKKSPGMHEVDFVQDGDLNKSLKFLCESIVDEFDKAFIDGLQSDNLDIHDYVCTKSANYCKEGVNYDIIKDASEDADTPKTEEKTEL